MNATKVEKCTCNVFGQHKRFLYIALVLVILYFFTSTKVKTHNFDYLVFSQRWLPTACIEYIEHNSSHPGHCVLPKNYDFWAIHGLWPTQNHQMGPFFCNSSMPFDVNKLLPIQHDLKLYWPNIEGGHSEYSLWQHEWEKHGTCAAQLKSLDTEFKYFNTGLNLFKKYNILKVLEKYENSKFRNGISVSNIFSLIKAAFNKLPQIHCIHEAKTSRYYLSEIRLCYNKNLELIDCGSKITNKSHDMVSFKNLSNCPWNSLIYIPHDVDPQINEKINAEISEKRRYYNFLVDLLRISKFLMWGSISNYINYTL